MDVYRHYATINTRLRNGESLSVASVVPAVDADGACAASSPGPANSDRPSPTARRVLCSPRIGIYAGRGTSHSWLWFVDLCEQMGFLDLSFPDETTLRQDGIRDLKVLAISGGDTFAVAEALGDEGAAALKTFVDSGGLYIGSCAGAYLPMNSSKTPLNMFNFAPVKITNLSKILPRTEQVTTKFCTAYGCEYIFHPVREAVQITTGGQKPFPADLRLEAPLYGGPAMTVDDPKQILATYTGFTPKTAFLVNRELAADTLIGKAAAVRVPMGQGSFYLLGPHLEHPRFAQANRLVADAIFWETAGRAVAPPLSPSNGDRLTGTTARDLMRLLKRELSNSRIVAAGMEIVPVSWLIGRKYYEPEKIRVYIESMWRRIRTLEKAETITCPPGSVERLRRYAEKTTGMLCQLKRELDLATDEAGETAGMAHQLLELLHHYARAFLAIYFSTMRTRPG